MKRNIILTLLFIQTSLLFASERAFRVERYYPTVSGIAVAWGIPGVNLDFEELDRLGFEEAQKQIDINAVRNYVVDIETNKILDIVQSEDDADFVSFNLGDYHIGNHYSLSLEKLSIQNLNYNVEAIVLVEGYKWSSNFSKLYLIDRNTPVVSTTILNGTELMNKLNQKLKLSITKSNMDLFENGAMNIHTIERTYKEKIGDVNIITLDYSFPKSEENSLEVKVVVKFKYENGVVNPYIISVKQNQI